MKKLLFGILALSSCLVLTGCFRSRPVEEFNKNTEKTTIETNVEQDNINEETNTEEVALSAIREALKDEVWVKENLYMRKSCFGEEATFESGEQKLTFRKLGKDRVIVQAFSYDDLFGIANTIVSFKDGKVVTFSEPSLDMPGHPGHVGYTVDPENEILVSYYMHMGYYITTYSKILEDHVEVLANFEGAEYGEDGILLENESGDVMVDYKMTIDGKEESGKVTFDEYENMISEYDKDLTIESIDIPLTNENVDLYVK